MTHTLTISGLDDFEADHISEILSDYKRKMLMKNLEALAENNADHIEWIDQHLAWHESIMTKVKWTKE